jgi:predicted DNA-binding antitoxin AbrB/MazE fold protein
MMTVVRMRYENGRFVPLDPIPGLRNGDEVEVELKPAGSPADVAAMLDRTRGLWADWDGIEGLIDDARARWDQAWRDSLSSS